MKLVKTINLACKLCKRTNVKHYAKGFCANCYHNRYYHNKVKKAKKELK